MAKTRKIHQYITDKTDIRKRIPGSLFAKLVGIYETVTFVTTSLTVLVFEFNFDFTFHKICIRPLFRWVTASNLISEQESLASRQEEMATNLTSDFSGGGSFSLTSLCQIGQSSFLHYVLLGLTVSPIFGKLRNALIQINDPGNGFFVMYFHYFSGLVGFKYNLWKTVSSTDLGRTYF